MQKLNDHVASEWKLPKHWRTGINTVAPPTILLAQGNKNWLKRSFYIHLLLGFVRLNLWIVQSLLLSVSLSLSRRVFRIKNDENFLPGFPLSCTHVICSVSKVFHSFVTIHCSTTSSLVYRSLDDIPVDLLDHEFF